MSTGQQSLWLHFVQWWLERRIIATIVCVLIICGGVYVAPFDWHLGELERSPIPVDAIPDIGENQQIVFTEWPGRSPRDVEDQVTYPLTASLMGIPGVRTVRSSSAFGFSSLYVIFEDDADFYWARARILEKLSSLPPGTLPEGVTPALGPDATALGQIFWYTLEGQDPSGKPVGGWDPDELRTIQDWSVRFALQSVAGVSEVASIGGFVREYQVDVDPEAMRGHGVNLAQVADAVRKSNLDVGARTLEVNGVEYLVRGRGFIQSLEDLEATVIVSRNNTPIRIRDVGHVALGPALRRGALDDEGAPAVGGVVVARYMENPLEVIEAIKSKIKDIQPGLPSRVLDDGTVSKITIVPFYDRAVLINETLETLSSALYQQILITMLVVLLMLRSFGSSFVISAMLPLGVLGAFICMRTMGVDANIMALGGIAIAIGTMVDIGIVFIENITQHLERSDDKRSKSAVVADAVYEVAPAVLTSVMTTVVSFIPVFGLNATELRLFGPLALTKTFAMVVALAISVVVLPTLAYWAVGKQDARLGDKANPRSGLFIHLRSVLTVLAGGVLTHFDWFSGILVIAVGLSRAAAHFTPSHLAKVPSYIERGSALLVLVSLLGRYWLPLGPDNGAFTNVVFVGVLVGGLMGIFRIFESMYPRMLRSILRHKGRFLSAPIAVVFAGIAAWLGVDTFSSHMPTALKESSLVKTLEESFPGLGREYMPPFDEGSFLYMPTTMPHASIGEALTMLSEMDASIAKIPEVDRVVGKIGRVESALDPAPVSMVETVITYHPEYRLTEDGSRERLWRDHIRSPDDIWAEILKAAERPGITSAPILMPINARLVMLQTGMRAPLGMKVKGPNLEAIESFGLELEAALKQVPGIRPETVFADRVVGKPYLEIELDREAIGRYGLRIVDVQSVLQIALGGMTLTRTVEGRERYPVRVRYMREERDSIEAIERIFVPTPAGEQIPITQLAEIQYVRGPQAIRAEDTFLTSYVLFDRVPELSELGAVKAAEAFITAEIERGSLRVPQGVSFEFAGTYESQVRSEARIAVLIPLALTIVFALIYLQFQRVSTALIIFSGVVVAVSGGFLALWLYGHASFLDIDVFGESMRDLFQVGTINVSVAVWIGLIALIGVATDDGVIMATYLRDKFEHAHGRLSTDEIREKTVEAGCRRIRACLMTTATTLLALLPVISSSGRGADVMVPMALPLIGGMSIALLSLFVVPTLYCWVEERRITMAQND